MNDRQIKKLSKKAVKLIPDILEGWTWQCGETGIAMVGGWADYYGEATEEYCCWDFLVELLIFGFVMNIYNRPHDYKMIKGKNITTIKIFKHLRRG